MCWWKANADLDLDSDAAFKFEVLFPNSDLFASSHEITVLPRSDSLATVGSFKRMAVPTEMSQPKCEGESRVESRERRESRD